MTTTTGKIMTFFKNFLVIVNPMCVTHLWFDIERRTFFLSVHSLAVIAWIHSNFHLSVKSGVDIRNRVYAFQDRTTGGFGVAVAFPPAVTYGKLGKC